MQTMPTITQENITLPERLAAPTPKLFRTLRTIGLTLAGIAGAIMAAPVALPAIVVTVAGYVAAAGTVAGAISSLPVDFDALTKKQAGTRYPNDSRFVGV